MSQQTGEEYPSKQACATLLEPIELTRHVVALPGLPDRLRGTTLVHLSDFHRGNGNTDPIIEATIKSAASLDPDIVALTGDFVNHRREDILPVVKMVSQLRARQGVFAVLGNHDYYADAVLLESALEAAGICVLKNSARKIEPSLWIAGVDDLLEGSPDLERTMQDIPANSPVILLAHNPNFLHRLKSEVRPTLMLSGHTHGGQFAFPLIPPKLICLLHLRTRFVHGWYRQGSAQMYVNRGVSCSGWGFLARRFRCHPEITYYTLTTENPSA